MGNQPLKPNQTWKCELNHPILSNGVMIREKEQLQIELVLPMPDKNALTQWEARVGQYRIPQIEGEVLFLPRRFQFHQEAFCGSTGFAKIRYSAPPLLLSHELENRIKIMQYFSQQQIWYLLYLLTYAAHQIHLRSLIIGDVRPKNIFLFPHGSISIGCLASFPDEMSSYLKMQQLKERTFLSPQQLLDLNQKKADHNNPYSSENFSIGLTIMGLMMLHQEQHLYSPENHPFQRNFRRQIVNLANCSFYSQILRKIVIGLMLEDAQERVTSAQVVQMLKPYEQKIMTFDGFTINSSDSKQIQRVQNVRLLDYRSSKLPAPQPPLQNISFGNINIDQNQYTSKQREKRFSTFAEGEEGSLVNSIKDMESKKGTKVPESQVKSHSNPPDNKDLKSVNIQEQQRIQSKSNGGVDYGSKSDAGFYQNEEFVERKLKKNNGYTYVSPIQYKSRHLEFPNQSQADGRMGQNLVSGFSLEAMGRQARSVRNTSQKKQKNLENHNQYENVLKHIDEQLQRSRQLFPNNS